MKMKEKYFIWIAILIIVLGCIVNNHKLSERIKYQEDVAQMLYQELHKHMHESDSLWIYDVR